MNNSEWGKEFPKVNGFYWMRGHYHYADLPVKVDDGYLWVMFGLTKQPAQDFSDAEFLGPITPDSLTRARQDAFDEAIAVVQREQNDYLATAAELAKQSGNDDGTDVFTNSASVTIAIIEELEAARDKEKADG